MVALTNADLDAIAEYSVGLLDDVNERQAGFIVDRWMLTGEILDALLDHIREQRDTIRDYRTGVRAVREELDRVVGREG